MNASFPVSPDPANDVAGRPALNLLIAAPRGFCAGVDRAIEIVEKALERYGSPVFVRHEIVHNKYVVEGLKAKGAIFVKELDEVPDDAPVVFSAHGVPKSYVEEAGDPYQGEIETCARLIIQKLEEYDFASATVIGMVMLLFSLLSLLVINGLQVWGRHWEANPPQSA